jgi:hypothetical protein
VTVGSPGGMLELSSTPAAIAHAARAGRRAGERFRREQQPAPNPFQGIRNREDLAAAWRRAYLAAAGVRRRDRIARRLRF